MRGGHSEKRVEKHQHQNILPPLAVVSRGSARGPYVVLSTEQSQLPARPVLDPCALSDS